MKKIAIVFTLVFFFLFHITASAQSTEFSYQGQLQNASALASGVYDFEFALFGSAFGGGQLGSTQTRSGVNVANGIFSVSLDFGNQFDGSTRFLEIRVRQSGGGAFTTLSPRQSIASSPYSVRSLDAQNSVNSQTAANAANATNAVNATTAINFTGPLAGDVTGTQGSTTVSRLRGTNVAGATPTNGQVLKFNSGANQWQPDTDSTGSGGGGTITGLTAGTGLTGGGTTGSVTVGIANSGVGTTQLADGSVSNAKLFDGAVTDAKIANGQVVKSINSLRDNVTLAAGSNITITPSGNTLTIASTAGGNSILNQTTQQAGASFNISGVGTANNFNAATQYEIGGTRVLSITGTENLFAGVGAGAINTGFRNTFIGFEAGKANTSGFGNYFFGYQSGTANTTGTNNTFVGFAGIANTTGSSNAFFGSGAGLRNISGSNNAFFGSLSGNDNVSGIRNAFFGPSAGLDNVGGGNNAFFGSSAGSNSNGNDNSFFGADAGAANSTGSRNAFFGRHAGLDTAGGVLNTAIGYSAYASSNLTNATAIGACAAVTQNNSIVLGSIPEFSPAATCGIASSINVGIGTPAPASRLHVVGNTGLIGDVGIGTTTPSAKLSIIASGDGARVLHLGIERGWVFKQFGTGAGTTLELTGDDAGNNNKNFAINTQGGVGIGTQGPLDRLHVFGDIRTGTSGTNGCLKNNNGGTIIGTCSSDLRFKRDITPFRGVLQQVTQLQPKYFYWRTTEFANKGFGPAREAGLIAQDVEQVFPELVVTDESGYKAVDYSKLPLLAIQAIKEQQVQIDAQSALLATEKTANHRLSAEIKELRMVVCSIRPKAKTCRSRPR